MKKLAWMLLLIFGGCGALVDPPENDPRFDSIKEQFEKDAAFFGYHVDTSDISIAFGDTRKKLKYAGFIPITKDPGPSYGYCLVLGKTNNDIKKPLAKLALGNRHHSKQIIISDELKNFSVADLEATVYHELGHCALGLAHHENEMLMSTTFNGNLHDLRFFLLEELFTRKRRRMPRAITKTGYPNDGMVLLYASDYELMGARIFYQLYQHPETGSYYYKNEP